MSDYTALIAAWNGATQPPAGVSGVALTAQMTTAQKIAAVNGWTVIGTIPAQYTITGSQLESCVKWSELAALTDAQRKDVEDLIDIAGPIAVGSSAGEIAGMADGMIIAYFGAGSVTVANLSALAPSAQPWWQASVAQGGAGLDGPVGLGYVNDAGLS